MIKPRHLAVLAPLVGSVLFGLLYVVATWHYPGGSQADAHAPGFSWRHNYWCNLLSERAINGQPNPARPIATAAMLVLGLTLGLFWVAAPQQLPPGPGGRRGTQVAGVLALLAAGGLLTSLPHDVVTNVASLCAVVATAGIFSGLHALRWRKLFWLGVGNLLLVGVNNLCYYHPGLIRYLPVVQKITFATFLLWVCGVSSTLYRSAKAGPRPTQPTP